MDTTPVLQNKKQCFQGIQSIKTLLGIQTSPMSNGKQFTYRKLQVESYEMAVKTGGH